MNDDIILDADYIENRANEYVTMSGNVFAKDHAMINQSQLAEWLNTNTVTMAQHIGSTLIHSGEVNGQLYWVAVSKTGQLHFATTPDMPAELIKTKTLNAQELKKFLVDEDVEIAGTSNVFDGFVIVFGCDNKFDDWLLIHDDSGSALMLYTEWEIVQLGKVNHANKISQNYRNQTYRFGLIQNFLKELAPDHPARLKIEPELLASDEGTDFEELFDRLMKLIANEWEAKGIYQ